MCEKEREKEGDGCFCVCVSVCVCLCTRTCKRSGRSTTHGRNACHKHAQMWLACSFSIYPPHCDMGMSRLGIRTSCTSNPQSTLPLPSPPGPWCATICTSFNNYSRLGPIRKLVCFGPIRKLVCFGPIRKLVCFGPIRKLVCFGPIRKLVCFGPIRKLVCFGPIRKLVCFTLYCVLYTPLSCLQERRGAVLSACSLPHTRMSRFAAVPAISSAVSATCFFHVHCVRESFYFHARLRERKLLFSGPPA
jgi:hypothetical protein